MYHRYWDSHSSSSGDTKETTTTLFILFLALMQPRVDVHRTVALPPSFKMSYHSGSKGELVLFLVRELGYISQL